MSALEFREFLKNQPFIPLRLHMSDGRTFEIRHPEMALLTVHSLHIGLDAEEPDGIPAMGKVLSLRHVVSVEPLDSVVTQEN